MNTLIDLYNVFSPSKCENPMRKYIKSYCRKLGCKVEQKDGNVYVTKGISDTYPCVVAHMDQVQRIHDKDFKCYVHDGIIMAYSRAMRRNNGLGADDKNGIWVALKCLEQYDVMKCAFFWGEEIGCQGSSVADMTFFDDVRFVLQCDRRNGGDLITSISGTELCSQEFLNAIGYEGYGYKQCDGLFTDVLSLKERGLKVSCLNMSCGYYNPHTDDEVTDLDELMNCLAFVKHIIDTCTDVYPHEYDYGDPYGRWYRGLDYKEDMIKGLADDLYYYGNMDMDEEDIKRWYKDVYPGLTDRDIEDAMKMADEMKEMYEDDNIF